MQYRKRPANGGSFSFCILAETLTTPSDMNLGQNFVIGFFVSSKEDFNRHYVTLKINRSERTYKATSQVFHQLLKRQGEVKLILEEKTDIAIEVIYL